MPARALFVLLVMLNFGVATWWLLRPGSLPPSAWAQPEGVPRLQLLGEAQAGAAAGEDVGADGAAGMPEGDEGTVPGVDEASPASAEESAGTAPAAAQPSAPAVAAAVAPAAEAPAQGASAPSLRCLAFGPYADASSVAAARGALQPLGAARMRVRDEVDAPRGWSVSLAPQSDRAAADALAARIRGAGFDDLLVIPSGEQANGIALGRYGGEAAARRREAALRAAGFPAQARPLGDASTRHWLDVAVGQGFDADAARGAAGAARVQDVDCAGVIAAAGAR